MTDNPPNSPEAEEAVIGAVLINPEVYFDVSNFLQADDFYIHRHQWLWQAFASLGEQHFAIDLLTVTEELDRKGQLNEIGGPAYLTSLVNHVPDSVNAEHYGHIVESHSIRRKMINAANSIASMAYNENLGVEKVLSEATSVLQEIKSPNENEFQLIGGYVNAEYGRISRGETVAYMPLGWIDLDRLVKVSNGDLVLVAARPSLGKTGFLIGAARHAAEKGRNVALFSLEMSNEQVTQRIVSQQSGVDLSHLRNATLSESEWPLFLKATEEMGEWKLFMHDVPAVNPSRIWAACRKLQKAQGLDLVIVDYLQLMGSDKKIENRVQEVSFISRSLKVMARELNVPVIAAAQLSRAVEQRADKRPMLSDLRESGSLEMDADTVIFIHRPDQYEKEKNHLAEMIVAKQRNGPVGSVELVFRNSLARFDNAATKMFKPSDDIAYYAQHASVGSED